MRRGQRRRVGDNSSKGSSSKSSKSNCCSNCNSGSKSSSSGEHTYLARAISRSACPRAWDAWARVDPARAGNAAGKRPTGLVYQYCKHHYRDLLGPIYLTRKWALIPGLQSLTRAKNTIRQGT